MINYPQIDPVLIKIGPLQVRWYGMAYILGLLLGGIVFSKVIKKWHSLDSEEVSNYLTWVMAGILIGGRVGYVLIYNLPYYLSNPAEMIAIWQGGMAFHGGATGAAIASVMYAKRYSLNPWAVLDGLGVASTIGITLGRLANFINGELVGRVTTLPWAMVFPGYGPFPRHPSQLYEAAGEGLLLLGGLLLLHRFLDLKPGVLFGLFCSGYGLTRFVLEYFREPDPQLGTVLIGLSMGQLLCILMIVLGALIVLKRHSAKSPKEK